MTLRHTSFAMSLLIGLVPVAASEGDAQVALRNLELKAHLDEFPPAVPGGTNYSACWSYVHPDGREYALLGVGDGHVPGGSPWEGTAIYNVTDPASPYRVAFIPGPPSIWREMKSYRNWSYVVTEGYGAGEGVQILRMTDPENPVLAATYTGAFHISHTVSVDTSRALLVCNGTRYNGGGGAYYFAGTRLLSLASPESPVELSAWPPFTPAFGAQEDTFYVHDSVPVGDRLYASSVYHGIQRVIDISNPAAPVQIAAWNYPGGFTHNAWPDKTGNWLYLTDERNGEPLKVFDISNLSAPTLFNTYTANPAAIVHNAHVWGDDLYLAHYTEGIRILDISDPAHPAEFAHADTYAGPSGNYNGVWEVCAEFPSGTVIASDRTSGLWVFRPKRDYGLARVRVVSAGDGQPLADARVFRTPTDSLTTTVDGVAVFALDPGSHTLTARVFGYDAASAALVASVGSRDTVELALAPRPLVRFSGVVRSAADQTPLEDAEVVLAYSPLHEHTDAAGEFEFPEVPEGGYRVEVRRPGSIPAVFEREIGPGDAVQALLLAPAPVYDPCETGTGWTIGAPGDEVTDNGQGRWILVDPLGTRVPSGGPLPLSSAGSPIAGSVGLWPGSAMVREPRPFLAAGPRSPGARPAHQGHETSGLRPGPVQPEDDRTPGTGTKCFVTGQGTDPLRVEEADVDAGRTTLTSPRLDATGMPNPIIGFWRWFYSSSGESTDYLAVLISNDDGSTWVPVDTVRARRGHWEEASLRVADFVVPSSQLRMRFVAADEGGFSLVEAAVDDLILYDDPGPLGPLPGPRRARLALGAPWPNPTEGGVRAVVETPSAGRLEAEVVDLLGRRVVTVLDRLVPAGKLVLAWDGRDAAGRVAPAGVYFLRAATGGEAVAIRFVLLP